MVLILVSKLHERGAVSLSFHQYIPRSNTSSGTQGHSVNIGWAKNFHFLSKNERHIFHFHQELY